MHYSESGMVAGVHWGLHLPHSKARERYSTSNSPHKDQDMHPKDVATYYPTPQEIPGVVRPSANSQTTMTPCQLLSFAQRNLKLVGQIIMWKNSHAWDLPRSETIETGETMVFFDRAGQDHSIRYAELS
jgi:hypothetical protein